MLQTIVFTLNSYGNVGCFPECVVVDTDENNQFSVGFIKITKSNKSNYLHLMDETDLQLFDCCQKLQKEVIASKVKDYTSRNWESVFQKYFETQSNDPNIRYIRNYLTEYIESKLNIFFSLIADKPLFYPTGRFPFNWKPLLFDEEMPEHLYCFEIQNDKLYYWPEINWRNKTLSLSDGILVSRKPARVLVNNKILEFDDQVDGLKLTPFFNKGKVVVPQAKIDEYIEKVILPLVATNRVLAFGFEIRTENELKSAVLRVKEIEPVTQRSLFDEESASAEKNLVLELIFEYPGFQFWAGRGGKSSKVDLIDGKYSITKVERDTAIESLYINLLKEVGLDLDGKIKTFEYFQGIEWINTNYKAIEATGVDISFKTKQGKPHQVFIGERKVKIEIEEERDWFDIKGIAIFGKFKIPFVRILSYIRQNRHQFVLPNGEYVQIPQSWFDEFKPLGEFAFIDNGKVVLSKQHCMIAQDLKTNHQIMFSVKENMKRLLTKELKAEFDLPKGFQGELRQYQHEGYNWLRLLDDMSLGGCLADDMGLGKTIQTLCLLQWQKETHRGTSLLIVPTSLIYNWQNEAERFTPELSIYTHTGSLRSTSRDSFNDVDVVLTSYGILRRDKHLFSSHRFNYIILDEAQAIKNPQSDISQVCLSLKGNRYLTLTGTPIENSLSDLWSQVHFFNRNMLGSLSHFMKNVKDYKKQELYRKLLYPFLLRRNKMDVLPDLPEKQIIVQWCNMTDAQHKIYKEIRNSYREKFLNNRDKNGRVNAMVLLEGLLRLRQISNHPLLIDNEFQELSGKFESATQMLQEIIGQGDKVLVFSSFVEHLKLYRQKLDELNIHYAYLDGSTIDRKEQVEQFQNNPDIHVFLLSLKAGGVGLNLTAASYVFLLDPWWNPAAEAQAYDRAHRIGQQNKVFVYKFITKNTIEEKILKLQESKLAISESMLSNENELLKQLNIDDVMNLIA